MQFPPGHKVLILQLYSLERALQSRLGANSDQKILSKLGQLAVPINFRASGKIHLDRARFEPGTSGPRISLRKAQTIMSTTAWTVVYCKFATPLAGGERTKAYRPVVTTGSKACAVFGVGTGWCGLMESTWPAIKHVKTLITDVGADRPFGWGGGHSRLVSHVAHARYYYPTASACWAPEAETIADDCVTSSTQAAAHLRGFHSVGRYCIPIL